MMKRKLPGLFDKLLLATIVVMFVLAFCVKPAHSDVFFLPLWSDDNPHDLVWYKIDQRIIQGLHNHDNAFNCIIKANEDVLQDMIAKYAAYGVIVKHIKDDQYAVDYHALYSGDTFK